MINIIAAVSQNNVIGKNGTIPWHYPEDFKRFKQKTESHIVIMGRRTFASMQYKPLKNRMNIVVSSQHEFDNVENVKSLQEALLLAKNSLCDDNTCIWLIGGYRIYEEGLQHADVIDMTYIPEHITVSSTDEMIYFPKIDETIWCSDTPFNNLSDSRLIHQIFYKKNVNKK